MKCFGFHKWKKMPWMKTRDRSPRPDWACLRCGKIKYDWVLYIPTIEAGLGDHLPPFWEGQTPPEGFSSWKEVSQHRQETIKRMLEDMRKKR